MFRRVGAIAILTILLVTGAPVAASAASDGCPEFIEEITGMKACI